MPRRTGSRTAVGGNERRSERPRQRAGARKDPYSAKSRCDGARQRLAYESARILTESGPVEFDRARRKAASRLGISDKRCWPDNEEINDALIEQQRLFGPEQSEQIQIRLRRRALDAMREFEAFSPRLIGAALRGTATTSHGVELRLFADSPEEVLMELMARRIPWEQRDEPQRFAGGTMQTHPVFEFLAGDVPMSLQVLPWRALRHPPLDPVSERPERGLGESELAKSLAGDGAADPLSAA
jgi:hypothetical protein